MSDVVEQLKIERVFSDTVLLEEAQALVYLWPKFCVELGLRWASVVQCQVDYHHSVELAAYNALHRWRAECNSSSETLEEVWNSARKKLLGNYVLKLEDLSTDLFSSEKALYRIAEWCSAPHAKIYAFSVALNISKHTVDSYMLEDGGYPRAFKIMKLLVDFLRQDVDTQEVFLKALYAVITKYPVCQESSHSMSAEQPAPRGASSACRGARLDINCNPSKSKYVALLADLEELDENEEEVTVTVQQRDYEILEVEPYLKFKYRRLKKSYHHHEQLHANNDIQKPKAKYPITSRLMQLITSHKYLSSAGRQHIFKSLQKLNHIFDIQAQLKTAEGLNLLQYAVVQGHVRLAQIVFDLGWWQALYREKAALNGSGKFASKTATQIARDMANCQMDKELAFFQDWENSMTSGMKAARGGNAEEFQAIMNVDEEDLDATDIANWSVLQWAVAGGNLKILKLALNQHGRKDDTPTSLASLLRCAVLFGQNHMVEVLLDRYNEAVENISLGSPGSMPSSSCGLKRIFGLGDSNGAQCWSQKSLVKHSQLQKKLHSKLL